MKRRITRTACMAAALIFILPLVEAAADTDAEGIRLIGAITETIELSYFAEGAKSKCHGTFCKFTEEDGKKSFYTGIPLWLMCGWVDDENKHENKDTAFNDELAEKGYRVILTASDGKTVVFASRKVTGNNNIILANKLGPKKIEGFPTLISADPEKPLKLESIVEIRLEFE